MILIDALHINNGGGKVLLDYLIDNLENTDYQVYYLLDDRVQGNIPTVKPQNQVEYLKATLLKRYLFYKKHKTKFTKIFSFGNLPPTVRTTATVYTYFHQLIYLEIPTEFSYFEKIKYKLKILFIKTVKNNTDFWIVQNTFIKKRFSKKYGLPLDAVLIVPFFVPMPIDIENLHREQNSFIYVSDAGKYKNHIRLIEAFCRFYDVYKTGTLTLTVTDKNKKVSQLLKQKLSLNYPITNLGVVKRKNINEHFRRNEFLIYPSLSESFGLPIVEAIENGCKVIGAQMPYMFEVCEPSIIFNPKSITSMENAFKSAISTRVKPTEQKIFNEIDELLVLLE